MSEGFLRRARVAVVTRERYSLAYAAVVAFNRNRAPPLTDTKTWDSLVVRYIEHLFLLGEHIFAARYALYGVIFYLELPRRAATTLPKAKETLRGFAKSSPEVSRDPPPIEVVWLLVDALLRRGSESISYLMAAALSVICFDGYVRPSEALAIRRRDVTPPTLGAAARGWAITIAPIGGRPSKNAQFDSGFVVGILDRNWVCNVVDALYSAAASDDDFLFGSLTLNSLESMFRESSRVLGIKILPHGLRHAGPSHDAVVNKMSIEDIQVRGRWLSLESCRHYSKPAALLRQLRCLSRQQLLNSQGYAQTIPERLTTELKRKLSSRTEGRHLKATILACRSAGAKRPRRAG